MIQNNGSQEKEFKRRETMAWSKFGHLSKYLQDAKFPLDLSKEENIHPTNITVCSWDSGYN